MGYIITHIAICYGFTGTGKTLFLTWMASIAHKYVKVVSNFKLNFPNCFPLKIEDLVNMKYENTLLLIDELPAFGMDSRRSMSSENIYIGYFTSQSRKRGVDVIGTAQIKDTVDYRFGGVTSTFDIVSVGYDELEKGFVYDFVFDVGVTRKVLPIKTVNKYDLFHMYDTLEIIQPRHIDELVVQIQDKEGLDKQVDEIAKEIKEKFKWDKLTHSIVYYFLLKLRKPKTIEPYVYSALQYMEQEEN